MTPTDPVKGGEKVGNHVHGPLRWFWHPITSIRAKLAQLWRNR